MVRYKVPLQLVRGVFDIEQVGDGQNTAGTQLHLAFSPSDDSAAQVVLAVGVTAAERFPRLAASGVAVVPISISTS
jgi:hypothetical protein